MPAVEVSPPIDRLRRRRLWGVLSATVLVILLARDAGSPWSRADMQPRGPLAPCRVAGTRVGTLCGTHEVWEDRDSRSGRRIPLDIVLLPAKDPSLDLGPVFWLAGGPGGAATDSASWLAESWIRERHDVVLVDQRGTGDSNPLGCGSGGRPAGLTGSGFEDLAFFERCRDRLERIADLTLYTTPIAMDDLDEVRTVLGYSRINLWGGSYGTRAALVYLRRHPDSVRAAVLSGVAPASFTNPLYHAPAAQAALDLTFAECREDPACNEAFPDLHEKMDEVLERLAEGPVRVTVAARRGGTREVEMTRAGFAAGLRTTMYSMPSARAVPLLVYRAWEGNYRPVAEAGLRSLGGIDAQLQIGMLLSVTCAEDAPRIDPEGIADVTDGTFLGDHRVRTQLAVCAIWPQGAISPEYGEPVVAETPVLLWSGTLDPVTPPRWGAEAARHLTHSLHLVVLGAHGIGGRCVASISRAFLQSGSADRLDTSCVAEMQLPPFELE